MAVHILHLPRANLPVRNINEQAPCTGVNQVVTDVPSVPEEGDIGRFRNQSENPLSLSLEAGRCKERYRLRDLIGRIGCHLSAARSPAKEGAILRLRAKTVSRR